MRAQWDRRRGIPAGLLVLLSLAGCGGGSTEGKKSGSSQPPETVVTTSATPSSSVRAQGGADRLRSIVLTSTDVGPGYADEAKIAGGFNKEIEEALATCGRRNTFLTGTDQPNRAESPLRRDGITATYSMAVSAPSEAEAQAVMDLIGSDGFPACMSKAVESQRGDDPNEIVVAEIPTVRTSVANRVDRTLSLQNKMVLRFPTTGGSVTGFTDYVFLQKGRDVAEVVTLAPDPTPPAELQRLVDLVAERLKR